MGARTKSRSSSGALRNARLKAEPSLQALAEILRGALFPGLSFPLSRLHSTQVPKVKTVLICSPAGEGSRPRKRYCPFRVRFADETLQDTALRYWERNRAGEHTKIGGGGETSEECRGHRLWLQVLREQGRPMTLQRKESLRGSRVGWHWAHGAKETLAAQALLALKNPSSVSQSLGSFPNHLSHRVRGSG